MKNLKAFISLILVLISCLLVGCRNQNSPSNENTTTNENEQTEMTTFDILNSTYNSLNNLLTEKTSSGVSFAEQDGKNSYDLYISQSLLILNEISLTADIEENKVLSGNELTSTEENDIVKVEKFYISNKKSGNINNISILMLFSRKLYSSNPLNFLSISFNISYDISNNEYIIDFLMENSTSYANSYIGEETQSSAKYYSYNYNSKDKFFNSIYFYRTATFDYEVISNISPSYIKNYNCLIYDFQTHTTISLQYDVTQADNKQIISQELSNYNNLSLQINNLEKSGETNSNISNTFILLLSNFQKLF